MTATTSVIVGTLRLGAPPLPSSRRMRAAVFSMVEEQIRHANRAVRVIDLGSGWGGLARALAAAHPEVAVVGVERSLVPWLWSIVRQAAGGASNLTFLRRDLLDPGSDHGSILITYLSPTHMERLAGALRDRHGDVLISVAFALPDHEPESTVVVSDLYRTPVYSYRLGQLRRRA